MRIFQLPQDGVVHHLENFSERFVKIRITSKSGLYIAKNALKRIRTCDLYLRLEMNYNGWTKADLHNNPMYSIKMCAIFRTLSFLSFLSVLPMCRKEDGTEHPQIADLFFGFLQTSYAMSRFPCCRLPFRISARSTFGRKCRFRNKYALRIINASASVDVANSRIQIKSPIKPLLKITLVIRF